MSQTPRYVDHRKPRSFDPQRAAELRRRITERVKMEFASTVEEASPDQIYEAVGLCVRDDIMDRWIDGRAASQKNGMKCVIYLSAEFLIGRALTNNMVNLGTYDDYAAALASMGLNLGRIEEHEADAGLGNGGLGRLAACFLDSLSTLDYPAMGCGIRYEYGFFRQRIHEGAQIEVPDDWGASGDIWEIERPSRAFEVRFGGDVVEHWDETGRLSVEHRNYKSVYAVPYDMPIVGYDTALPATLRLWSARAPHRLDLVRFNSGDYVNATAERELAESISKVLYPEDNHEQGKKLRLRQFYFLVSATMQSIVSSHKRRHGDLHTLPEKICVQINDTHPALAIPELIRLLIDEEGFSWEEAVDIAERTFSYTNHTIMPEALERWDAALMREQLPRVYRIVETIDARFRDRLWQAYPGDVQRLSRMAIIDGGKVRMANLCVLSCGHVNGVSQLHGQILKDSVFRDFYANAPRKFCGITNGITQRRWLAVANPRLAALVDDAVGPGFMRDWRKIAELEPFAEDPGFRAAFDEVKALNKASFSDWMRRSRNTAVDPSSIIDTQAKRLHEYKRQLMKVLHILWLYDGIVEGRITDYPKTTFVFAAKAAPGYARAKQVIRLINAVARLVEANPLTRDVIPVVFFENYDVSGAQRLIPATDLSEQISTAGREASGTGNMKFMLNGALTLGTMDGANVEMAQAVGMDNIFIFGATVEELRALEASGAYRPGEVAAADPALWRALQHLVDGSLAGGAESGDFADLYRALVPSDGGGWGDPYYVLHDFAAYAARHRDAVEAYADRDRWVRSAVINTAKAGFFSSDRTIEDYNRAIWHLEPVSRREGGA